MKVRFTSKVSLQLVSEFILALYFSIIAANDANASDTLAATAAQWATAAAHKHLGVMGLHRLVVGALGFLGIIFWCNAARYARARAVSVAMACASCLYAALISFIYA